MIGNIIRLICAVLAVAMLGVSVFVYGAPPGSLLLLVLFFVVYVQLPGMLAMSWSGFRSGHISTNIAVGMFTGWALSILVYFISDLIRGDLLLILYGPLLTAAYIWMLVKKKRNGELPLKRFRPDRLSAAACVFFVIALFYCLVNTQYMYLSPETSEFIYFNPDKAYHMGIINSLSHDYPVQSPWVAGVFIHYHIFSEIVLSIPVRLFGLGADVITQSFGPLLTAVCFCTAYYSFFREMMVKKERAGVYCLLVLLANMYCTKNLRNSLALKFVLINDNSTGYGIAVALLSIIILKKWYEAFSEGSKDQWRLLVFSTVFIALSTGIKGPVGAVTIASLWGTVILGVLLRKMPPKTMLPLLVMTGGFVIVYMTVLGSGGQSNASGNSLIDPAEMIEYAYWKKPLFNYLMGNGVPKIIVLGILLAVFMVFLLTLFLVPFCVGYLRELFLVLSGRKPFDPAWVLVYAECAVGLIAMMLLNYSGHSQIYFGFLTVFLAPAVSYRFLEDMEAEQQDSKAAKIALNVTVGIMALTLVLTTWTLADFFNARTAEAALHSDPELSSNMYMNMSKGEYEAMEWIEDNTEEEALFASDRYFSIDPEKYECKSRWDNRFFLYEVYSNRFSYISGSGYSISDRNWQLRQEMIENSKRLYDADNEERGDQARELGVDYVIVSKRINGETDLANRDYELVFSNEDVDLYRVAG